MKLTHDNVSYVKSAMRIIGLIGLPVNLFWTAIWLILAEVLGFVEELV